MHCPGLSLFLPFSLLSHTDLFRDSCCAPGFNSSFCTLIVMNSVAFQRTLEFERYTSQLHPWQQRSFDSILSDSATSFMSTTLGDDEYFMESSAGFAISGAAEQIPEQMPDTPFGPYAPQLWQEVQVAYIYSGTLFNGQIHSDDILRAADSGKPLVSRSERSSNEKLLILQFGGLSCTCGQFFRGKYAGGNLVRHLKGIKAKANGEPGFPCGVDDCHKTFPRHDNMHQHIIASHPEHTCALCNWVRPNDRRFECDQCHAWFSNKDQLEQHMHNEHS